VEPDVPTIAVITPFLDKSHGSERCLAEQLERIARHYRVRVYTERAAGLDLSSGNISLRRVPGIPGPHLVKFVWFFLINHVIRAYDTALCRAWYPVRYSPGINCFDANLISVHILFHSLSGALQGARKMSGLSLAGKIRLLHRRTYYRMIMFLERLIYRNLDIFMVYVSRRISGEVTRYVGRSIEHTTVIHHAVETSYFNPASRTARRVEERRRAGIAPTDFVLLLIGNDWVNKGLATLVDAVRIADDHRLVVVAAGSDGMASFLGRTPGAAHPRVILLPPEEGVLRFYAMADAYVGPSLEDAFGLPPLEAMACGLPVIVSSKMGVSEIITDGDDGLILKDPEDAGALAELITRLLREPALCRRLGLRAYETACSHTWNGNSAMLKNVIDGMLRQEPGRDAARELHR
jgi:glycosyltransferase involved in cell wall biosynthesis